MADAKRYTLGPSFGFQTAGSPTVPPVNPKTDPAVTVKGLGKDTNGKDTVQVTLPAYDPAVSNLLVDVRAYLLPSGTSAPTDPAAFLSGTFPFVSSGDLSAVIAGADVDLPLPEVPAGNYIGQILTGFDA